MPWLIGSHSDIRRLNCAMWDNSADVSNGKFLNELLKYNNLNTFFAVATGFEKNLVVSNASSLRFPFLTGNKVIVMNILINIISLWYE